MHVLAYCPACDRCQTVDGNDLVFGCRCECGAFLEEFYRYQLPARPRWPWVKRPPQAFILLIGILGFIGMALYVPFQKVEREFSVVGSRETDGIGFNILAERAVRITPVEYHWIWSERPRTFAVGGPRPTDAEFHVAWQRLGFQAVTWVICLFAAMAHRPCRARI